MNYNIIYSIKSEAYFAKRSPANYGEHIEGGPPLRQKALKSVRASPIIGGFNASVFSTLRPHVSPSGPDDSLDAEAAARS